MTPAEAPKPLGYVVLIREHGRWTENWDGELHPTAEAGNASLAGARDAGYTAVLTAATPFGDTRPQPSRAATMPDPQDDYEAQPNPLARLEQVFTEVRSLTDPQDDREARRARILAMSPDDRAALARIMRCQLDQIPRKIVRLEERQQQILEWLAEFAASPADEGERLAEDPMHFDVGQLTACGEVPAWVNHTNDRDVVTCSPCLAAMAPGALKHLSQDSAADAPSPSEVDRG